MRREIDRRRKQRSQSALGGATTRISGCRCVPSTTVVVSADEIEEQDGPPEILHDSKPTRTHRPYTRRETARSQIRMHENRISGGISGGSRGDHAALGQTIGKAKGFVGGTLAEYPREGSNL